MLYCGIHGKVLSTGERKKKDGTVSPYIDVYIEESEYVARVHNYHDLTVAKFDEVTLAVKVYSNENGFYITHAD